MNALSDPMKDDLNPTTNDLLREKDKTLQKKPSDKEKDPKGNQILSAQLPIIDSGPLQVGNLQEIKNDVATAVRNNVSSATPFFEDLMHLITNLQEKGDISAENFICPWYIAMIFLEMLNEHMVILKIHSNLHGNEDLTDITNNFNKFFRVVLFLLENKDLSRNFKAKILKKLKYNITILNEKIAENKTTVIEYLLNEEKFDDLDLLIRKAKTAENCKAHAIEEMENTIIIEIAHKIIKEKKGKSFDISGSKQAKQKNKNNQENEAKFPILMSPLEEKEEKKEIEMTENKENEIKIQSSAMKNPFLNLENSGQNAPGEIGNVTKTFKALKQDIITYCVEKKMNEITKILFRKFPNEALSTKTINLALENRCYDYLKEGSSMSRITKILIETSIMKNIISFLNDPHTFLDAVFFLYSIKDLILPQETQKLLNDTIKSLLSDPKINRIFLYNMNPLLIFVMLCQTFDHLSKKCFHYQHSFKKISLLFKVVASQIVEKYDHFYNLKKMTYQIFYPAKIPVIRMIFQDKDLFDTLFEDDRLAKITRLQLNSFYIFDWNILACSTGFKYAIFKRPLIMNKTGKSEEKVEPKTTNNDFKVDMILGGGLAESIRKSFHKEKEKLGCLKIFDYISKLEKDEVNNEKHHCYQYKIYWKSIAYRTLWDAIIFLSLFIYLHVNTNQYSGIRTTMAQIDPNYTSFMDSQEGFFIGNGSIWRDKNTDDFLNETSATIHCENELTYLTSYYNGTSIDSNETLVDYYLPSCVTFHLQEVNLQQTSKNLMDLCFIIIITCCNVFVRKFYQIYVRGSFNLRLIDQLDLFGLTDVIVLVFLNYFYSQSAYFSPDDMMLQINVKSIFIALLLFMFWLQMFQYIKYTQVFGYIVKTVELLIKETYEFLWIFFLFIAAFSSINYVLFGSFYNQFSGFFVGVRNLFGYALGGFIFLDGVSNYYVVMSAIINIIYVLFTNVILINLLIALLSNIYQKVSDNSDLEYSSIIYDLREEKYFDKTYGSMAIYPRVINTFLLPFHILTVVFANPKLNKAIGSVGYYITLINYGVIFVALHCFIIPVAWANILVLILVNKYHDNLISKQVTIISKFLHIMVWFFLGMPYLCYVLIFNDFGLFIQNAFCSTKTKRSDSSAISLLEYQSLKRTIKYSKNVSDDLIDTNVFIKEYVKIALAMESSNNWIFRNSKDLLNFRTSMLLKDIRSQDTGLGVEEFEKRVNLMEFKLKKMIDIINTFSISGKISVRLLHDVLHSLKLQIKHSPGRNKLKEINKLEVVNYKEILDIFLSNLKEFQDNK